MTNKENLINKVTDTSQSQKDRIAIDSTKSLNIINFLNAQIKKATSRNELKDLAVQKLIDLIQTDDPDVSIPALIKLLEVIDKGENDFLSTVMNTLTDIHQIESDIDKQRDKVIDNDLDQGDNISTEDLKKVKKVLDVFKKLEKSEFSEG